MTVSGPEGTWDSVDEASPFPTYDDAPTAHPDLHVGDYSTCPTCSLYAKALIFPQGKHLVIP